MGEPALLIFKGSWAEYQHARYPKGHPEGGRFRPMGAAAGAATATVAQLAFAFPEPTFTRRAREFLEKHLPKDTRHQLVRTTQGGSTVVSIPVTNYRCEAVVPSHVVDEYDALMREFRKEHGFDVKVWKWPEHTAGALMVHASLADFPANARALVKDHGYSLYISGAKSTGKTSGVTNFERLRVILYPLHRSWERHAGTVWHEMAHAVLSVLGERAARGDKNIKEAWINFSGASKTERGVSDYAHAWWMRDLKAQIRGRTANTWHPAETIRTRLLADQEWEAWEQVRAGKGVLDDSFTMDVFPQENFADIVRAASDGGRWDESRLNKLAERHRLTVPAFRKLIAWIDKG